MMFEGIGNSEQGTEKTQLANGINNATQMMPTPGAEATQMAVSVTCPVCHSVTPGGEMYCNDCGFLLSSEPVEVAAEAIPSILAKMVETSTGREFILNPGENTIGRENADVLVTHPTASRKHAKITVVDGKYILEDVGSSNGTFIGSKKVEPGQPVEVEPGTEITFGSAVLRLDTPAPDVAISGADAVHEIEQAEDLEKQEEEFAEIEEADKEAVPSAAEDEAEEETAAEESEEAEIPIAPGVEASFDATPEQALEAPIEPVELTEEEPVLARLVPTAGGEEFQLKQGENTVGRRPGNSIIIPDPYTSGSHAVITAGEDNFVLTDLGSTNGTSVNGEKLNPNEPRTLSDGDEITFGQATFRFEKGIVDREQGTEE